jgi:hypothetical protein
MFALFAKDKTDQLIKAYIFEVSSIEAKEGSVNQGVTRRKQQKVGK